MARMFHFGFCERGSPVFKRFAPLCKNLEQTCPATAFGISAVSLIRKTGSRSNSILIEATDGLRYVVKIPMGRSDARSALREALGSELATLIGLPVPPWQPIFLSESFIRNCPEISSESLDSAREWPTSGYYFGSQCFGTRAGDRIYDYLPVTWMDRIENRADFVGMLLLDLWANNTRRRQAIFIHREKETAVRVAFIGHRQMFASEHCVFLQPLATRYSDSRIYRDHWTESTFSYWRDRIASLTESTLTGFVPRMPGDWSKDCDVNQIVSVLLVRQKILQNIRWDSIRPCDQQSRAPFADLPIRPQETLHGFFSIPALIGA
jgi:hypothetical protein